MSARNERRLRRQEEAPRKVGRQSAEPEDAYTTSGEGRVDDNGEEVESQFWDQDCGSDVEAGRWDDVVKEYVNSVSSRLTDGRKPVVHDSGWRKRNGRRMRLVLVEGERMPMQRQWVLDIMKRALWSHDVNVNR